jgi:16S rRNA (guanine527-N7)-methyltransferase
VKENDFKEIMAAGLDLMDLRLSGNILELLEQYYRQLMKWNRSINLIAAAPMRKVLETHFLDSLTLLPFFTRQPAPLALMDVGSGAGFPGLVLKIALPELPLTLVEPRHKRVSFLRQIIRSLALEDVAVYAERLDPGKNVLAGEKRIFPVITSRAFAAIDVFLGLAEPFSPRNGTVICMKGPNAGEEIIDWRKQDPQSPFILRNLEERTLPFSRAQRCLVFFEKKDQRHPQG